MRRVVSGLGLLVATLMVFDTVSSKPPDEEAAKGIRAIVAHGKQLNTSIAIGNIEVATSLYNSIALGMFTGDRYPYPYSKLSGRPCIGIAAFILKPNNEFFPAAQLWPEWADFKYWFYPAGNEPAVAMTGRILPAVLLDELTRHGIPVRLESRSQSSCEFEPARSPR